MRISLLMGLAVLFVCMSFTDCAVSEEHHRDMSQRQDHRSIGEWLRQPGQIYPSISYALITAQLCVYHYYSRIKWNSLITIFISLFYTQHSGVFESHSAAAHDSDNVAKFHRNVVVSKARYPWLVVWLHVFAVLTFTGSFTQIIFYGPRSTAYGPYIGYWMAAGSILYFMDVTTLSHAPALLNVLSLFVMAIAYTSYTKPGNTKPSFGHVLYESISLFSA